ncbi:hypothetical protein ACF0H5_021430 [Mactra antiquata]
MDRALSQCTQNGQLVCSVHFTFDNFTLTTRTKWKLNIPCRPALIENASPNLLGSKVRVGGNPEQGITNRAVIRKQDDSRHFIDGKPTLENPDPEPASRYDTVTPVQPPPKPRPISEPPRKKVRTVLADSFDENQTVEPATETSDSSCQKYS